MSKFHINKHGIPAPCKATKGNCPLGGSEAHFSSQEEAQEYADSKNENEYGILSGVSSNGVSSNNPTNEFDSGNYLSNAHRIPRHANENLRQRLTPHNIKQVLSDGFEDGDIDLEYDAGYMNETPVKFNANISKVGNDKYRVAGKLEEHSYVERDFDTKEEYDEYAKGDPDGVYEVDYEFSADELEHEVNNSSVMKAAGGINEYQSAGAILNGVYRLTRNEID